MDIEDITTQLSELFESLNNEIDILRKENREQKEAIRFFRELNNSMTHTQRRETLTSTWGIADRSEINEGLSTLYADFIFSNLIREYIKNDQSILATKQIKKKLGTQLVVSFKIFQTFRTLEFLSNQLG